MGMIDCGFRQKFIMRPHRGGVHGGAGRKTCGIFEIITLEASANHRRRRDKTSSLRLVSTLLEDPQTSANPADFIIGRDPKGVARWNNERAEVW
jgi:hypothetical protein